MSAIDEKNINPIDEMIRIAHDLLGLASHGFKETYRSSTQPARVIFDSEWCRIRFTWGGWDYGVGNSMNISYGRLHASNEKDTMPWNGEECRCWHRIEHALHFLDGHTPAEVARIRHSHPITDAFYGVELVQRFHRRQPEWVAQMHLTIWQEYGQRLFDLFDLRRPNLWQQYQQFLKEVYDIAGRKPRPGPPMDKVC